MAEFKISKSNHVTKESLPSTRESRKKKRVLYFLFSALESNFLRMASSSKLPVIIANTLTPYYRANRTSRRANTYQDIFHPPSGTLWCIASRRPLIPSAIVAKQEGNTCFSVFLCLTVPICFQILAQIKVSTTILSGLLTK